MINTTPMQAVYYPESKEPGFTRQKVLDAGGVRRQSNGRATRVLFVTSEAEPLAKSGGLADVSRALPIALKQQGIDVRILLPGYPGAIGQLANPRIETRLKPMLGVESAALISGRLPGSDVPVWLVHAPSLFSRAGGLYQDDGGQDWTDNALRFAFLARVATEIAAGRVLDWKPDVVHANDWHAGLVPLLLAMEKGSKPATVFTIHNLAFQGNFPREVLPSIGIPEQLFTDGDVEFYGQVSYLKAAIHYSDKVTTVSPTYASEVLSPELGCGLDGALQARKQNFCGILNGIDNELWDPAKDVHLPHRYSRHDISGKRLCKAELQRTLGLEINPRIPLVGFVSRLAHQKMADVILENVPSIMAAGAQFALVGEGDPVLEVAFEALQRQYPHRVAVHIGYEEALAHRLQAGVDILLAPARFEPCGLTQLYALRYGTVPVVRRTGGLADTVTDIGPPDLATGFVFEDPTGDGLMSAIGRALALYKEPLAWRRLQLKGMAEDFGWAASAERYAALYHQATGINYSVPTLSPQIEGKVRQIAG
ncbi:MAG: glycogen synthase GlgA [Pseudomonadota bacterium]